jgi:hypothetical protein
MTNVVDCDPASLSIGMALKVSFFELSAEVGAPVFVPA